MYKLSSFFTLLRVDNGKGTLITIHYTKNSPVMPFRLKKGSLCILVPQNGVQTHSQRNFPTRYIETPPACTIVFRWVKTFKVLGNV